MKVSPKWVLITEAPADTAEKVGLWLDFSKYSKVLKNTQTLANSSSVRCKVNAFKYVG